MVWLPNNNDWGWFVIRGVKKAYVYLVAVVFFCALTACGGDRDKALDKAYQKQQAQGNIMELVRADPTLSTLNVALESAELDATLSDENSRFTLFAPTDAAFSALGQDTINALLSKKEALSHILRYHVLAGSEVNAYSALQLAGKTSLSANGIRLSINRWEQKVFINGVAVTIADRKATNGVVHIIDSVLLPPDIENRTVSDVKTDILEMAEAYKGLTDSDFTLQRTFEPLLAELMTLAPQAPVADRLNLVAQPWKQVWGPYSYGSGQDGVDPDVSFDEVYQVIFEDGYYYNVTPLIDDATGNEQIGMLKGEFVFDQEDDQCLQVQFVNFPGLAERPEGFDLWALPELQESGAISSTGVQSVEIVPSWIVSSFFGGGQLCEIYTDETMRISISREDDNPDFRNLYILTKIQN